MRKCCTAIVFINSGHFPGNRSGYGAEGIHDVVDASLVIGGKKAGERQRGLTLFLSGKYRTNAGEVISLYLWHPGGEWLEVLMYCHCWQTGVTGAGLLGVGGVLHGRCLPRWGYF